MVRTSGPKHLLLFILVQTVLYVVLGSARRRLLVNSLMHTLRSTSELKTIMFLSSAWRSHSHSLHVIYFKRHCNDIFWMVIFSVVWRDFSKASAAHSSMSERWSGSYSKNGRETKQSWQVGNVSANLFHIRSDSFEGFHPWWDGLTFGAWKCAVKNQTAEPCTPTRVTFNFLFKRTTSESLKFRWQKLTCGKRYTNTCGILSISKTQQPGHACQDVEHRHIKATSEWLLLKPTETSL